MNESRTAAGTPVRRTCPRGRYARTGEANGSVTVTR